MRGAARRDRSYLEIIGGEPTIRPDIFLLVETAKKFGFKDIVMATNGRLFSYNELAKKIITAGITSLIFSIHGHNSKLHDSLTQAKGSFDQLMKGIKNVISEGLLNIGSNTTIVRQNYKFLPKIAQLIAQLGIRNSEFIFVDSNIGGARTNFDTLVPKISKCAPYIKKCLDIGSRASIKHWHIRYVPVCHFSGYENQISELNERRNFRTEHLAPDFKNFDEVPCAVF